MADSFDIIDNYVKEERKRWLYKQIYALEQKERDIMLLTMQSGLNDEKIALLVGKSVANIRVIRYRIKQKLIKLREEDGL